MVRTVVLSYDPAVEDASPFAGIEILGVYPDEYDAKKAAEYWSDAHPTWHFVIKEVLLGPTDYTGTFWERRARP